MGMMSELDVARQNAEAEGEATGKKKISEVARVDWIGEARPSGVLEEGKISLRKLNIFFYTDGSAGMNVARMGSVTAHTRIDFPAPVAAQLRAALFDE